LVAGNKIELKFHRLLKKLNKIKTKTEINLRTKISLYPIPQRVWQNYCPR